MFKFITDLLIKLLVASITRHGARAINRHIIKLLHRLADRTHTEADDDLVATLEYFLKTRKKNGHGTG